MYARGINERTFALGGVSEANDPKPQGSEHNAKHNWGTNWKPQTPIGARIGNWKPKAPKPQAKAPKGKKEQAERRRLTRARKPTPKAAPSRGAQEGEPKKNTKNPPPKGASPPLDSPTNGALPLWIPQQKPVSVLLSLRAGLPPIPREKKKKKKIH